MHAALHLAQDAYIVPAHSLGSKIPTYSLLIRTARECMYLCCTSQYVGTCGPLAIDPRAWRPPDACESRILGPTDGTGMHTCVLFYCLHCFQPRTPFLTHSRLLIAVCTKNLKMWILQRKVRNNERMAYLPGARSVCSVSSEHSFGMRRHSTFFYSMSSEHYTNIHGLNQDYRQLRSSLTFHCRPRASPPKACLLR